MHARTWAKLTAGVAALLMLAGCSGTQSGDLEPAPGELDWEVGVTRATLQFGASAHETWYHPWSHQMVDYRNNAAMTEVSDEHIDSGLELMCAYLSPDSATALDRLHIGEIVQEAVNGAVLASASDEFREVYGQSVGTFFDHKAASEGEIAAQTEALDRLHGELNPEWVELYELQNELVQTAFTLENSQAAQAAVASRCGITLEDGSMFTEPAGRAGTLLIEMPARAASDSEDQG